MKSFAVIAAVILSTVIGLSAQDITNQGASIGRRVGEGLVVSKRQADLDALKTLTVERARKTTDVNAGDAKALATGFARELDRVSAYGSLAQLLDRNMPELARQGYVGIRWMFDAVNPDRVHVTQEAWNGQSYDYDEWITIGTREFDFFGSWLERSPGRPIRIDLGKKLGISKYSVILKNEQPVSAANYEDAGRRYVLLTYRIPIGGDLADFFDGSGATSPFLVELWIDSGARLLAKARVVPSGAASGKVPRQYEQLFLGYSDDIRVDPPGTAVDSAPPSSSMSNRTAPNVSSTPPVASSGRSTPPTAAPPVTTSAQGTAIVPLTSARSPDGVTSTWEITQQRVDRLPVWDPRESSPPLSLVDAYKAAETWLKRENPEVKAFELQSVNLSRGYGVFAQKDRWFYNISLDPIIGGRRLSGGVNFLTVVLMDGSVVEPRVDKPR